MFKTQMVLAIGVSLAVALPAVAQGFGSTKTGPLRGVSTPGVVGTPGGFVQQRAPIGFGNPYQTSTGFYNPAIGTINYPAFGAPVSAGGNYYNVPSGSSQLPMWRAPSGYYYPWCPRPTGFVYAYPMPVLFIDNRQASTPAPALPPLSTVMGDLEKFLDDSKKDGKISERDHTNMSRRVKDLKSKERTLRISAGGSLDPGDESQLRTDLDQVGSELSWRLNR